ncbi:MAG: response regulator [Kiloniellales bacterium]|nr:response regulator [Kiloniellales bacterium]
MMASILVVDDEPDVVELFKRRFRRELRRGEYAIHFAGSADEALAALKEGVEPAVILILSDINMPGMSGLALLAETKRLWPSLPVAMITAYGDEESRRRAFDAGASDFLTKPLDFDELKTKVAQMLASR